MAQTVLVGSTGFVGGNLMAAHTFDAAYHSTDVAKGFGCRNELVVYAGVPATMFLANRDPAADLAVMAAARENLRRLAPRRLVLKNTGDRFIPQGSVAELRHLCGLDAEGVAAAAEEAVHEQ